jgi:alkylhydroperoxidase/carboxymuconolactone decarboxylase family protein YurZ
VTRKEKSVIEKLEAAADFLTLPDEIRDDFMSILTRVGGEFWTREGLEPRMRSLATMAVLCARGQWEELAIHVRLGEQAFGLSRAEICELILHCALYAGAPAAVSGMKVAAGVFEELDAAS